MNNEFKKISSKNETRYILETMTAGATGSANIATRETSIGELQKRLQELKQKVTQRNFVAKHAKTSGSGAHRNKKKEQNQGKEKHKKPFYENDDDRVDVDRMLANIEKEIYQQGLKGEDALHHLRVKLLDLALNRVGRDKRKGYEPHVMNVNNYDDAKEFLTVVFRDAVEQGVAENFGAIDRTTNTFSKELFDNGFILKNIHGVIGSKQAGQPFKYSENHRKLAAENDYTKDEIDALEAKYNDPQYVEQAINKSKVQGKFGIQMVPLQQGVAEGSVQDGFDKADELTQKFQGQYIKIISGGNAGLIGQVDSYTYDDEENEMTLNYTALGSIKPNENPYKFGQTFWAYPRQKEWIKPEYAQRFIKKVAEEFDQDVAEGSEKRCMQCGMKNCSCPPGKCGCKPIAGWIPNKGFKKQEVDEEFDNGEYNDEAGMFKNDLQTILRVTGHLEKEIGDNENLPEWCQTKIATARSMIVTVMDYIISQHENGIQPDQDVEENYRYRYQGRDPEQLAGWADDPDGKNDWVLWIIDNKTKKSRLVKRWPALSTTPPTSAKNYQAAVEKNAAARGQDISTMLRLEPGQSYNESVAEAHPNSKIYDKCWTGHRKVPGKKRGEAGSCKKIGENEYFDKLSSALESKLKK